ncbi:MAG: FMN-binding protein [Prevotella sp.]|jgi:electron transport complex protein RnfG
MKKRTIKSFFLASAAVVLLASAGAASQIITKEGKTTVVNTTELTKNIRGFHGPTPVKIYITKNKITKIEPLRNQETPKLFARAKTLLAKYEGMTVSKAQKAKVDGVTGATYSSKALIKNVQEGLKYYKKH